jgi:hypothetical protein
MATTTPNFGWAVPTSTDLVKDGAVAIETLGDSIDASLVDLKGGTTGQVLAKASGTDMDFSWVAIDPLVILDAKGDLITATAADTPARLAVGTNGQTLVADSSTSTGLKWATASAGGTFAAWTPTWTGVTVGNGTVTAQYAEVGSLVYGILKLEWGSTTSQAGDAIFSLPVTGVHTTVLNWGTGIISKAGQAQVWCGLAMNSTTTMEIRYTYAVTSPDRVRMNSINAGFPYTMANGDSYGVTFWYRKA